MFVFFERAKVDPFDDDTRPTSAVKPLPPERHHALAKRRRYAHTFSAGRQLKKVRGKNGQNRWRVVPDFAIVHYGKQFSHNKKKRVSKTNK